MKENSYIKKHNSPVKGDQQVFPSRDGKSWTNDLNKTCGHFVVKNNTLYWQISYPNSEPRPWPTPASGRIRLKCLIDEIRERMYASQN